MRRLLARAAPLWLAWLALLAPPALAQTREQSFEVEDVRITGLTRVTVGNFFRSLPIAMRERIDSDRLRLAMRQIFDTGQFDDIQFSREGNVLHINVVERPSINTVEVLGNNALTDEALLKGLEEIGLQSGDIFKRSTLESLRKELLRLYVSQGYYGATIDVDVVGLRENRVDLKVNIDEGAVSRIDRINIIGNDVFSDAALLGELRLRGQGGLFAFLSGKTRRYGREQLSGDLESLRNYYLNRGYLGMQIENVQVSISPDSANVYITVMVKEGDVHHVAGHEFVGELPHDEDYLDRFVAFKEGDLYLQDAVIATEIALKGLLNAEGYASAEVRILPYNTAEERQVKLRIYVDPGARTYVRRIEFVGNKETREEVLRRSMVQLEGDVASSRAIEISRAQLERTGFFKTVNVTPKEVPGSVDQVDLEVEVEEQLAGTISFSLGYNRTSKTFGNITVQRRNLLGTGNDLNFRLASGNISRSLVLSLSNPYFSDNGISLGWGFSFQETDYGAIDIAGYVSDTTRLNVNFGVPLTLASRFTFGLGLENTSYTTGDANYYLLQDFINRELNAGGYVVGTTTFGWSANTQNRSIFPTRGMFQSANLELAAGDHLNYAQFNYDLRAYLPTGKDTLVIFRNRFGVLEPLGGTRLPPFSKFYYAGGPQSVRGYDYLTLGPWIYGSGGNCGVQLQSEEEHRFVTQPISEGALPVPTRPEGQPPLRLGPADQGSYFWDGCSGRGGGTIQFTGSVEFAFPIPGLSENDTIRSVLFFDYGDTFASECDPAYYRLDRCQDARDLFTGKAKLRASYGVALTWVTGFGPLYFVYANALGANPWDRVQSFEFTLGQPF